MLTLLKNFLATYQLEMSPLAAPLIFLIGLLLIRFICMTLVTSQMKNLPKDDRKQIHKNFGKRSSIGWLLWFLAFAILVLAYFEMVPPLLQEKMYLWPAVAAAFLLSISLHYLAYAQATMQTLVEKKSLSIVS